MKQTIRIHPTLCDTLFPKQLSGIPSAGITGYLA